MPRAYSWLTPQGTGIIGDLDENGVVTFAVEVAEGSAIRGTELFNRMMDFFGEDAKAIRGVWRKGQLDRLSVNIDKVNELTKGGMPLEEAIQYTWTMTRAMKRGFRRIRLLSEPEGKPGEYGKIDVLIEK